MAVESKPEPEALPTRVAFVWSLPAVDSLVGVQVCAKPEPFATVSTLIWLLSRGNSLVGMEDGLLCKGLPTAVALVGFLPCVHSPVSLES